MLFNLIRLGRRRSGMLRSFFSKRAIAPNPFLRELPLTMSVRGSAMSRQMLMYLVRIPHRKGHSIQVVVLGGRGHTLAPTTSIQGPTRVGPNGRDLKLR